MRKFLTKISLYIGFFSLVSCILTASFMYYHDLRLEHFPAPRLSDSYSYNEKMHFLKYSDIRNPKILASGSSMTLINLHSPSLIEYFKTEKFLNISSWGIRMEENFNQIKSFLDVYDPTIIIIFTNYSDFFETEKYVNYTRSKHYITSSTLSEPFFHLLTFDLKYYINNFSFVKHARTARNEHQSLHYDKFGSVSYPKKNFKRNQLRWEHHYLDRFTSTLQYTYLDSISAITDRNDIELIVCQTPHREGLVTSFNNEQQEIRIRNQFKLSRRVKEGNFIFKDATKLIWPDSLFIDGTHLNEIGAKKLTEFCLNGVQK